MAWRASARCCCLRTSPTRSSAPRSSEMTASAWGLLALYLLLVTLLAWPVGRWMTALMEGRLPRWMRRVESPLYRLAGTDPERSMPWMHYALALLAFNVVGAL